MSLVTFIIYAIAISNHSKLVENFLPKTVENYLQSFARWLSILFG
ncbi:hypothetical protein GXM_08209 [Nostoc sphaeroides CCNUC1]|uniref:Uncharacterized protein n=1 Tax=Nostoc sphaeroides CCNUC1 TaxID=2653204 RepID=A0A5P8WD23_9NOSO|nr:hypothetical protein GXM_08209 [Nostoc sphaeroides CCNUC1]